MASASSSKTLKKYSDEDQNRKKKPKRKSKSKSKSISNSKSKSSAKSKSSKRRRDSSLSSYSSESDSDDHRRKKRKLKPKKPDKKKKESSKKTHKKKRRQHRSPSSSSCDTCSGGKSRSPVRRPKSRKRYRSQSPSCYTSSFSSEVRGRRSIRGRSPIREEYREDSALRRPELCDGMEDRWGGRDTSIKACDDYPTPQSNEGVVVVPGNDRYGETKLASEVGLVKDDSVKEKSVGFGNNAGVDARDLELILRQKALENFRKLKGGLSANKESVDDMKNEAATPILEEERWNPNSTGTSIPAIMTTSYQDKGRNVPTEAKGWTPTNIETSIPGGKCMVSSSVEGGSMLVSNQLKDVEGSSSRMSLQQITLAKIGKDKTLVPKPGGKEARISASSIGDRKDNAIRPSSYRDNKRDACTEEKEWNPNSNETSKPTGNPMVSSSIGDRKDEAIRHTSYNDKQRGVPTEERDWNLSSNEISKPTDKPMVNNSIGEGSMPMSNQLKNVQESSNGMSLEQTTLAKVAQDNRQIDIPDGAASIGDRKDVAMRQRSFHDKQRKVPTEEKDCNQNSSKASKTDGKGMVSSSFEGRSMPMPDQLMDVQGFSNRISSEPTTLAEGDQDQKPVGDSSSDKVHTGAVSAGDGSAPPAPGPNKDNENCKSNEPTESAGGSQFEQKTFCRVRDGETVQVKYKVYIPKKTPALARRKLQR